MLQPVSLGHHRCICPGLSLAERGIPLGQQMALFFPELSAVKAFMAAASAEMSFERLLPSLEIVGTETHQGLKNWMVRFDVQDTSAADPLARWARLHRGRVFTGTQSHFVPYRDQQAPTGYDLRDASSVVRGTSGLVVYGHSGIEERLIKKSQSLLSMTLNLGLNSLSVLQQRRRASKRTAFLVPERLSAAFFSYLQRLEVKGDASPVFSDTQDLFFQNTKNYYLVNCDSVPESLFVLMKDVPGIEVLLPVLEHVFVAWPFKHPFTLENIAPLFEEDRLYLFSGVANRAFIFHRFGTPTQLEQMAKIKLKNAAPFLEEDRLQVARDLESMAVPIHLTAQASFKSRQVDGVFIPLAQLSWIQKLLYRLPQNRLEESRAALTKDGIFILSSEEGAQWPMGEFFQSTGNDVFLSWGFDWMPHISARQLRSSLALAEDDVCFIRSNEELVCLKKDVFQPLSKATVSAWTVQNLEVSLLAEQGEDHMEIKHVPQKRFVLWRGIKLGKSPAPEQLTSGNKPTKV